MTIEAVQHKPGQKWHRVWWPDWMADQGVCLTHVGQYRPERDIRRPASEVPISERCRVCLTTEPPTTHSPDPQPEAAT